MFYIPIEVHARQDVICIYVANILGLAYDKVYHVKRAHASSATHAIMFYGHKNCTYVLPILPVSG